MSNSKNDNKHFGTILTNEYDKTEKTEKFMDKGGVENEKEKFVEKNIPQNSSHEIKENTKGKPEQIIGTGYDNDFIRDFGGEVHNNIKYGVGNVEGIYDDGKLFKDDYNYAYEKQEKQEKHDYKKDEYKHEEKYEQKHEQKHEEECKHCDNGGEWTCEDVLCETEFECECEPISEALADIVESIAHQENGIAKILESESKKICRAICMAECVDDLVKVNKSVQDTIKQVNNVQLVLISKLQEVSDICDGCCD